MRQCVLSLFLLSSIACAGGLTGHTGTNIDIYCAEFTPEMVTYLKTLNAKWNLNSGWSKYRTITFGNSITVDGNHWSPLANNVTGIANATDINAFKDSTINLGTWIANGKVAESGRTIQWVSKQVASALSNRKPMFAVIMIGTNDISISHPPADQCEPSNDCWGDTVHYKQITDQLINVGVIPIITTIPPIDFSLMGNASNREPALRAYNNNLRTFAENHKFPLIDLHRWSDDHGPVSALLGDWAHPSGCSDGSASFSDNCLDGGSSGGLQNVRNYMIIMAVNDLIRYVVFNEPVPVDTIPPGVVTNLSAITGAGNGTVVLSWTAPGSDSTGGRYVRSLDIRYSQSNITEQNFSSLPRLPNIPKPVLSGTLQSMNVLNLTPGQTYYFAMKAADRTDTSALSNVASVQARSGLPLVKDSVRLDAYQDTYFKKNETDNKGGLAWLSLSSAYNGITYLRFDMSVCTKMPDSAVIVLQPCEWGATTFQYTTVIRPVTKAMTEDAFFAGGPIAFWLGNALEYPSASYTGPYNGQTKYYFPVAREAIQMYAQGTAYGLAIINTDSANAANQFWSKDRGAAESPYMIVYSGLDNVSAEQPDDFSVGPAILTVMPNPFNPSTTITISNCKSHIAEEELKIYNVKGEMVDDLSLLINNAEFPIRNSIIWDASRRQSGVYVVKAKIGGQVLTKTITFLK
ncbi:MAG: hypothetical protein A2268_04640 [Candidatus Raymondbacteria bacterium RifOxyA12_full_50_37]|uniref:Fibronectin type-III domain-containing protein n=1 Tax=Candidatus Raymondbacteria bacterium RIFOXYD12_FULL_49_13 TaxID=1817890 RepID=A0A1F7FDB8_UNCRA|nr:MAG: hypothetical protein A2268_04640 [Candidatus Raymondbacteria bacterium RifOxyA12_full_50_37]OGJ94039.1 MAG: hypothetical protein A2248_11845 [Candidatus Raymondbacteria bacterium RIFOXYA2_FULL_49_16]OGJ96864.1 MAG: hypothetical protein A2453_04445 [Candidatus Raymondbacteria bacterium RIFOXYC2_FULL_50_21]OGJ97483.1 MAG: hypothetical protein A2487_12820 [Candidatus Raymondbacteria bacterium RifOxyC12_full_50_8]OGK00935.1 MAG: hypothetical protein A2350_11930 [Candidatus Raymondbacteria b